MSPSSIELLFQNANYQACVDSLLGKGIESLTIAENKILIKCYILLGANAEAINLCENMISSGLVEKDIYCNLARAHLSLGQYNQAIDYYHSSEKIDPAMPASLRGLKFKY